MPALLRAEGLRVHTLAEVYGTPADEGIADVEWLENVGSRGWPVLMKDQRIRYRPAERAAVVAHRVQAFFLTSGNDRAATMASHYLAVIDRIAVASQERGPFLYAVSRSGLRRVDLQ